jgi:hypothetical protein
MAKSNPQVPSPEFQELCDTIIEIMTDNMPVVRLKQARRTLERFNAKHQLQFLLENFIIVDGRSKAWSDERRAKMSELHAKRSTDRVFYLVHYKIPRNAGRLAPSNPIKEKTEEVCGVANAAKIVKLGDNIQYFRVKLSLGKGGPVKFKITPDHYIELHTTPPVEKSIQQLRDEFAIRYHGKHGIWPNDDMYPAHLEYTADGKPKTVRKY